MKPSQLVEMKHVQPMNMVEMKELNGGVIPAVIVAAGGVITALASTKILAGIAIFLSGFVAGAVTYGAAQLIKNKNEQPPKA